MLKVAVAGGNDPEIIEMLKQYQNQPIEFHLYDVGKAPQNLTERIIYHESPDKQGAIAECLSDLINQKMTVLVKGLVQTHDLLHEVLKYKDELLTSTILSHVAWLGLPDGREVLMSDAAMNIAPKLPEYLQIIENAVEVAHMMGNSQPKVALLSSAEVYNPKMPSSVLSHEAALTLEDRGDMTAIGPISLDLALSKKAVEKKHYQSAIEGNADILIVPNIDAGNILYKTLTMFTTTKVGGIIMGTRIPIALTSRGDKTSAKKAALDFALKVAGKEVHHVGKS